MLEPVPMRTHVLTGEALFITTRNHARDHARNDSRRDSRRDCAAGVMRDRSFRTHA
jgi:hypothetical protein